MITLENVSIDTLGLGNRRIQWEVVPTHEDLNTYVLDIYRAEAPGDLSEFDVVQSEVESVDGIYIDSGLERMDYSTNRQIYYYLDARNTSTLETSLFGPFVMRSEPDYVANYILRTYSQFFENPRYKTRVFYILKKRTWGNYCACIDPLTQEPRDESCEFCYGTGIEGGYFKPMAMRGMRADKPSRQMINLFGTWHDTNVMFKLQNTVDVIPGDYIIDEHNERWLIEGPVNHLQKGIYTIMSNVRAKSVSKSDQIYDYDLTEQFGGDAPPAEGGQQYGIFDGSTSVVDVPDNDLFSFSDVNGDKPFSISGWYFFDDATNNLMAQKGNVEYYLLHGASQQIALSVKDQVNNKQESAITDTFATTNTWMHITATYDGSASYSGINLYFDSVKQPTSEQASGGYTQMRNLSESFRIGIGHGIFGTTSLRYNGRMHDIKIFSKELTQADINQEYEFGNYTINMVGHYPLYTNTDDSSRYGFDGINTNVTFPGVQQFGVFNGTSSFVEVIDDPLGRFDFGDESTRQDSPFSFSVWVYITSLLADQIILAKGYEYYLRTDSVGRLLVELMDRWDDDDEWLLKIVNHIPTINQWAHLTFTYDGSSELSGIKIYMDAVEGTIYSTDESADYVSMIGTPEDALRIGRGFGVLWNDTYSTGRIRESILYDKELSAAEVLSIYNGTPFEFKYVECGGFSGAYITVPDDPIFNFGDGAGNDVPFSISGWIYSTADGTQFFLDKPGEYSIGSVSSGIIEIRLYSTTDPVNFFIAARSNTTFLDQWIHVVATYDGSKVQPGLKIYINSISDYNTWQNGTYTGMLPSGSDASVGFFPEGLKYKDLIYHDHELNQTEINTLYAGEIPTTGILANYPFADSLTDIGPNGIDAVKAGTGDLTYASGRVVVNYPLYTNTNDIEINELHGVNTDVTFSQE